MKYHSALRPGTANSSSGYHNWFTIPLSAGGRSIAIATKQGVPGHSSEDAAQTILSKFLASSLSLSPASSGQHSRSVHFGSGNGMVAVQAALSGFDVVAVDRSVVSAQATERSLEANGIQGTVLHSVLAKPRIADDSIDLVTIRIPADRIGLQMMIAETARVLRPGGRCVLAGENAAGARPAARLLGEVFGNIAVRDQRRGCRLVEAVKPEHSSPDSAVHPILGSAWLDPNCFHRSELQWQADDGAANSLTQFTRPGVFSWEHVDEATDLLANIMEIRSGESVLDLGCGSGGLGTVAALRSGARVTMVDSDADAVRCARQTALHAGAEEVSVMASDITSSLGNRKFEVVVTNPPFHLGKATDLQVPAAFIEDAHEALVSGGRLILVANRTLPYERLISERFGECFCIHDGRRFKILGAARD